MGKLGRQPADDVLKIALACGANTEAAARKAGVSVRTVYRRMDDPEFRQSLKQIRTDMVQWATAMLTAASMEAVKTLVALQAADIPPTVRLGAARAVLEMGREQIYHMYDLQVRPAEPIVPRYLHREIKERTTRDGTVLHAPDFEAAAGTVADPVEEGVESLAVSLLHSYRNPESEQALKAAITSRFPALSISISSDVAPVINEFERTSTTVADCYVKPTVSRYLTQVEGLISEAGYQGELLVMNSSEGVMDSEKARQHPVRLIESGPAAGAFAACFYGSLLDQNDLISLDIGGTTAKTCVIEGGGLSLSNSIEVARVHRFLKGSGLPIMIPVVDLVEIGAGGGPAKRHRLLGKI